MTLKVIITGASGFLGSAINDAFRFAAAQDSEIKILALSHSRDGPFVKLDLLDKPEVESIFQQFKPDSVIHCAAERRPDVAEKDPESARKLNAEVPYHLASLSKSLGFSLIYISTDYVFDGTSPPYVPSAKTNPLQSYGKTKRDGELAVLGVDGAKTIVLRVPVLYGPAPNNSDSAVNILLDVVRDQSGKQYEMDHYAVRYPTNIVDVASFLLRLSAVKVPIPTILHYSSDEPFTKYEMCLIFSKILCLSHSHITPKPDPPTGEGSTTRPRDSRLDTKETEDLGIDGGLGCSLFEEWWSEHLGH